MRVRSLLLCFLVALLAVVSVETKASIIWTTRPGTIGHAKTLQDGAHVYLDAVIIEKIRAHQNPAYLVVREPFDAQSRIVVMTQPSVELRLGQIVDIEGTVSTLSDGQKAVVSPTVYGYTDRQGNLLIHAPLSKGFLQPRAWEWKVDLTVTGSGASAPSGPPAAGEPNTSPNPSALHCSTISVATSQQDGTPVSFTCKPIASVGTNCFVMGQDGASEALKVYSAKAVSITDRLCYVSGVMQTDSEGRCFAVDASGPGYDIQVFQGEVTTAQQGTIAWAKTLPDDTPVAIGDEDNRKIVTRVWKAQAVWWTTSTSKGPTAVTAYASNTKAIYAMCTIRSTSQEPSRPTRTRSATSKQLRST